MGEILRLIITLYIVAIFLVIIGSWFPIEPGSPVSRLFASLRRITDPVLDPIRRVIPPVGGVLDLSPTIVIILLYVIRGLIPA